MGAPTCPSWDDILIIEPPIFFLFFDLSITRADICAILKTALRLRSEGIELQKKAMNSITSNQGVYTPTDNKNDSWVMEINKEKESLEWLIN